MLALKEIGAKIAEARRPAGLTQAQLARRSGVSRATVDALENGRIGDIGYSRLVRILSSVGHELALRRIAAGRPTLEDLMTEGPDD